MAVTQKKLDCISGVDLDVNVKFKWATKKKWNCVGLI